jgi:hypothetical protein
MESLVFDPPGAGCVLFLPGLPGGGGFTHDRTAHGNQGTITGAVWTRLESGIFCLTFDGVDDIVRCPDCDCLDITDNISIIAWVKRNGLNHRDFIVAKREGGAGNTSYQFEVANDAGHIDSLYFSYQDSSGNWEANVYSLGTVGTGWHQVAVTRGPQKIRFFIDGKPDPGEELPLPWHRGSDRTGAPRRQSGAGENLQPRALHPRGAGPLSQRKLHVWSVVITCSEVNEP